MTDGSSAPCGTPQSNEPQSNGPMVVGLGEVLFDCFPGRMVLGGAPVNVAVHAHQLLAPTGGRGVVVSRVGTDDLGRDLLEELTERGIVTNLMQTDARLPTGTVQVKVNGTGEPTYTIEENVAWEHIHFEESLELLASNCSAVCYGTLAQRSEPSRSTIQRFLETASSSIRLFDINLRQHFYTPEVLEASLRAASAVKLNQDELIQVGITLAAELGIETDPDLAVQRLQELYDLDCIALTRGCEGTVLYRHGKRFELAQVSINRDASADNVGAGDACSAGLVYGLLMDWESERILELANLMGAYVASKPGATPRLSQELLSFSATSSLPS